MDVITKTDRAQCTMKLRQALKEAHVANDELYSLGSMENFDFEAALTDLSAEEFLSSKKEIESFHDEVKAKLSEIKLAKDFSWADFQKQYNKIGCVMSWATQTFNYDNPLLNYVGEEE